MKPINFSGTNCYQFKDASFTQLDETLIEFMMFQRMETSVGILENYVTLALQPTNIC